jgi:hypothetical protein
VTDCRSCKFNSYLGLSVDIQREWFSCSHPTTLQKEPKPQTGDPKMVDYRTGDVRMRGIHMFKDCPAYVEASGEDV